jgi:hypothetical protein
MTVSRKHIPFHIYDSTTSFLGDRTSIDNSFRELKYPKSPSKIAESKYAQPKSGAQSLNHVISLNGYRALVYYNFLSLKLPATRFLQGVHVFSTFRF